MSLHKSVVMPAYRAARPQTKWQVGYPNPADFNFNFYQLLQDAQPTGIARNTRPGLKVAIVGAGIAGLTAARELFRCGYTHIDIFEASDRLTGRLYSRPVDRQYTTFELGAMRMPFFEQNGRSVSALGFYRDAFGITTQPFPDPGGTVANTGIYMNQGYGPDPRHPFAKPTMLVWDKGSKYPPNPLLEQVYKKWVRFAGMVVNEVSQRYGTPAWDTFWQAMVNEYWTLNFRDLVYVPALLAYDAERPGYFGGLGMTQLEAEVFYTIGAGDGSWGAFYDISCLYPIRTLLFGFGTDHQLIQGCFDAAGRHEPGPYSEKKVEDSLGRIFPAPRYLGVQSFAECMFFLPVRSDHVAPISLYDAMRSGRYGIHLFTQNPVTEIRRQNDARVFVGSPAHRDVYDAVILTQPTWALELSTRFSGFSQEALPFNVIGSVKMSHWISSCKVFLALKERYWERSPIPQLISTDTFLQGVYGYALQTAQVRDPGVVMLSYTWEDDSNKLLADASDEVLVTKCLDELDNILLRCGIDRKMSDFVDRSQPAVIQWSRHRETRGCAKLYRQRTWSENQALLTYNQRYSRAANLYFAGEAFSVEGGWTEPAIRLGLDAALHLISNTGGQFMSGFDFERDYPKYDVKWSPGSPGSRHAE